MPRRLARLEFNLQDDFVALAGFLETFVQEIQRFRIVQRQLGHLPASDDLGFFRFGFAACGQNQGNRGHQSGGDDLHWGHLYTSKCLRSASMANLMTFSVRLTAGSDKEPWPPRHRWGG